MLSTASEHRCEPVHRQRPCTSFGHTEHWGSQHCIQSTATIAAGTLHRPQRSVVHRRSSHHLPPGSSALLVRYLLTYLHPEWSALFLGGCGTSWPWQSIVVFITRLQDVSLTTVCLCLKFPVVIVYDLPTVCTTCSPQHAGKPDQQSGIHCQMICVIQLLTPNFLVWLKNNLFTRHYGALARCVSTPYKSTFCLLNDAAVKKVV